MQSSSGKILHMKGFISLSHCDALFEATSSDVGADRQFDDSGSKRPRLANKRTDVPHIIVFVVEDNARGTTLPSSLALYSDAIHPVTGLYALVA
jgi:hypothetical protein